VKTDDTFEQSTGAVRTANARNKTKRCEATDLERCRVARLFYQLKSGATDRSWIWQQIRFEADVGNTRKCTGWRAPGAGCVPRPRSPDLSVAHFVTAEAAHECLSPRV
jgi:hypothetical protein